MKNKKKKEEERKKERKKGRRKGGGGGGREQEEGNKTTINTIHKKQQLTRFTMPTVPILLLSLKRGKPDFDFEFDFCVTRFRSLQS